MPESNVALIKSHPERIYDFQQIAAVARLLPDPPCAKEGISLGHRRVRVGTRMVQSEWSKAHPELTPYFREEIVVEVLRGSSCSTVWMPLEDLDHDDLLCLTRLLAFQLDKEISAHA